MSIRILLADDHTLVRQGVRRILDREADFEVIAEASSGLQALALANEYEPDVAVIDIGMKQLNGIETTAQLIRHLPGTAVLILSMFSDERYVTRAMKSGARGYLLKDSVEEDLLQAIRSVHAGKPFFSPLIAKILLQGKSGKLNSDAPEDRYDLLTQRERQIYQLLAEGNSNKDIAAILNLSLHTVETHRTRVMDKMDVHSGAELVLSAVRRGFVT